MRHWLAATFILIGCKSNSDKSGATNQPPSGGQATNAALGSGTTTTGNADATAARGASSGSNGSNSGSNGALAEAPVPSGLAGPAAGTAVTTVGAAYLGIRDVGIVQLAAGKATTVVEHRFTLQDLAQLPNGEVVAIGIGGMWRLQKGKATSLDGNDKSFEQLAVSHKGAIWATGYQGVAQWTNNAWTLEPKTTFGEGILKDIAITPDDVVWVATSDALFNNASGTWKPVVTPIGDKPYFGSMVVGADGALYISSTKGIYKFAQNAWTETKWKPERGYTNYDELIVGVDGTVAGSGGVGQLLIASPKHGVRFTSTESLKLAAKHAKVQAIDGSGRVWISTDNGLLVLNNDASLGRFYPAGTLPGADGKIEAAVVTAGGPQLPDAQAAAEGNVTGQVIRGGKPVANVAVELCATPLTMFRKTPCGDAPLIRTATTGADGNFMLTNVPVGSYGFAIKPDAKWRILIGGECCTGIKAGETYAVGSITLDK